MSDEEVFAEEEIARGDGQELGGKTGFIPAVVLRLLKWVALGLGAVIFIVTIVVFTVHFLNKGPQNVVYPSDSLEYSEVPDILQWYDLKKYVSEQQMRIQLPLFFIPNLDTRWKIQRSRQI